MDYIPRQLSDQIIEALNHFPSIAILGPRQCGKSTLAKQLLKKFPDALYLDLEKISDRNKLSDPELFFRINKNKLISLDEIQKVPEIFSVLRSVIDEQNRNGQFLILGSASRDLIRQSSESLAGRIAYFRLSPFTLNEVGNTLDNPGGMLYKYWGLGGFPRSFLAPNEMVSFSWRQNFIETFLQRDMQEMGFDVPPETALRLWKMCAHSQGQLLNTSKFGGLLNLSHMTVKKYIDLFQGTFMLRLLQPVYSNLKKRMVKSPKVYVRDSGILHALLNIRNMDELFSHPAFGASWETMVIENIISKFDGWNAGFYRTSNGAEIDLVLERGLQRIAIECKASSAPKPSKGFYQAMDDLKIEKGWIIAPVEGGSYPLKEKVTVISLHEFLSIQPID